MLNKNNVDVTIAACRYALANERVKELEVTHSEVSSVIFCITGIRDQSFCPLRRSKMY